ncbi:LRR receptor-like serine/threonine-protein kinase [Tanacetum coccineum]
MRPTISAVNKKKILTERNKNSDVNKKKILTERNENSDVNKKKILTERNENSDVNKNKILTRRNENSDVVEQNSVVWSSSFGSKAVKFPVVGDVEGEVDDDEGDESEDDEEEVVVECEKDRFWSLKGLLKWSLVVVALVLMTQGICSLNLSTDSDTLEPVGDFSDWYFVNRAAGLNFFEAEESINIVMGFKDRAYVYGAASVDYSRIGTGPVRDADLEARRFEKVEVNHDYEGLNMVETVKELVEHESAETEVMEIDDIEVKREVSDQLLTADFDQDGFELASGQRVTEKSDVYSYGVVLLEVLTGRHPLDPTMPGGAHLVQWVRDHLQAKKDPVDILDPKLRGRADPQMHEMLQTLAVSFLCVSPRANDRPIMNDVVAMLKEIRHEDSTKLDTDLKGKVSANPPSPSPTPSPGHTRAMMLQGSSNCSYAFSDDST